MKFRPRDCTSGCDTDRARAVGLAPAGAAAGSASAWTLAHAAAEADAGAAFPRGAAPGVTRVPVPPTGLAGLHGVRRGPADVLPAAHETIDRHAGP